MNQYDFAGNNLAPIPPEDHRKMLHYIIAGIIALSVIIIGSCIF